jgi:hypothetical protein
MKNHERETLVVPGVCLGLLELQRGALARLLSARRAGRKPRERDFELLEGLLNTLDVWREYHTASGGNTKLVWYVVQEGGSSTELYLHGFDTRRQADAYRKRAAKSAYRTSPPVSAPRALADMPDFDRVLEEIIHEVTNIGYP